MAKIFTVHGTYATGPVDGEHWWQRGSVFEQDMKRYVDCVDGELVIEPVVWDGKNSETSRREAGVALHETLENFEKTGSPYSVIGHSHGGSVAGHAMLQSVRKKTSLPGLSRWITVGTPFIETKRHSLTFSRLGNVGRAVYFLLLIVFVFSFLPIFLETTLPLLGFEGSVLERGGLSVPVFVAMIVMIPICLAYFGFMKYFSGRKILDKRKMCRLKDVRNVSRNWISLWHDSDEAIASLNNLDSSQLKPFQKNFLTPFASVLSIAVIFFTIFFIASDESWVKEIYSEVKKSCDRDWFCHYGSFEKSAFSTKLVTVGSHYFLSIAFLLLPVYFLTKLMASVLGFGLAGRLNSLTHAQIKASALGSDMVAEAAVVAHPHPQWMDRGPPPLPDALANEISFVSDQAAASSIAKIRKSISHSAMGEVQGDIVAKLSEHLKGNELIHTTYFNIPRFRKLVAFAIAQGNGFTASAAFQADPDYPAIAEIYKELRKQPSKVGDSPSNVGL